jgi:hypothetical protein
MLKHRQEKLQHPTAMHQTSKQRLKADLAEIWASALWTSTNYCPLCSSRLILSTQPEMLLIQHFL